MSRATCGATPAWTGLETLEPRLLLSAATDLLASEVAATAAAAAVDVVYAIVDTGQSNSYDDQGNVITPSAGEAFYGQDAQHDGNQPNYTVSGDLLTVQDNVTGLVWTKSADWTGDAAIDVNDKFTFDDAQTYVNTLNTQEHGGYSDWRVPSVKELYSLIDFDGETGMTAATSTPYIDTTVFDFAYGDESSGERFIDSQWVTTTLYVSTVMNGQQAMFGVNFADGRIKGYGLSNPSGGEMDFYARFCRGNTDYGVNSYVDNADGTITDGATGLQWSQADSGAGMDWEAALAWVEQKNAENHLGHDDWRLPNAKELQSIVDYTRSPDTTSSAAIDPLFSVTAITDDGGSTDYPFFWSSTTHLDGAPETRGDYAVYVAFGEAEGWMQPPPSPGTYVLMDVHGAGAQRSDPKSGDPDDYPYGHGPQGDVVRIYNFVRLVRDADVAATDDPPVVTAVVLNGDSGRTVSAIEPSGVGVQTIEITFSEAVAFTSGDVTLQKVTFPGGTETAGDTLTPTSIVGSGTDTMTITFDSASVVDTWVKVTLDGSAMIEDLAGNALDGEAASGGSGRGYVYEASTDLPTGDGTAGGDAVFYVGSLRGDLYGGDLFEPDPNGELTDLDVAGFIAAYQGGNLDADFYGGDLFEPIPDGVLDDLDVAGFIAVYQAGASLGALPTSLSGAAVVSSASLSVLTESLADAAVALQEPEEKTTSSVDDSVIPDVATEVASPEPPVKARGKRGAKSNARSAAAKRAALEQSLADAESGADLPPEGDELADPLSSMSL